MKEVDLSQPSELSTFIKSKFEEPPAPDGRIQTYSYQTPTVSRERPRAVSRLVTTDILFSVVQVFDAGGGETVMHSHAGMDGFWMILSGRARFYFEDREPMEFGPKEGLCTPRGVKYWFEQVGDEPLEILQVDAIHPNIRNVATMDREATVTSEEKAKSRALYDAQT